ncbi:hypothetical protein ECANGB1_1626 [Enterospora canceri]|uniref:Uncharacterized protein n=1 Tax=Enterospora canceri TaxID=1081671 RepID=A0A1Y1S5M0_9MICR|nr:hypothetical protein ECANGB1_1626 [Enterospora canceri]
MFLLEFLITAANNEDEHITDLNNHLKIKIDYYKRHRSNPENQTGNKDWYFYYIINTRMNKIDSLLSNEDVEVNRFHIDQFAINLELLRRFKHYIEEIKDDQKREKLKNKYAEYENKINELANKIGTVCEMVEIE